MIGYGPGEGQKVIAITSYHDPAVVTDLREYLRVRGRGGQYVPQDGRGPNGAVTWRHPPGCRDQAETSLVRFGHLLNYQSIDFCPIAQGNRKCLGSQARPRAQTSRRQTPALNQRPFPLTAYRPPADKLTKGQTEVFLR